MDGRSFEDQPYPHSLQAERDFLASLMLCNSDAARDRMRATVWKDAFYSEDHKIIFGVMSEMMTAQKSVDPHLILAELQIRKIADEVGGAGYLATIIDSVPSWAHGESYGNRVAELAMRRDAICAAESLAARLRGPVDDEGVHNTIRRATLALTQIGHRRNTVEFFKLGDIVQNFLNDKESQTSPALMSGVHDLDHFRGIFCFGKYTLVAGRPSMGKSTIVRWLLGEWAKCGTRVGLIAVEENRQKIAGNYLSAATDIVNDHMAYGNLTADEFRKSFEAMAQMERYPWYGVDNALSIGEVVTAVDVLATKLECKVIAVDHIHLIGGDHRSESRHREINEISGTLKGLAKKHNVVLIVAAQLSRPTNKNQVPEPPTLTDLRDSGALEEHADAALFLHREDYYRPTETPTNECSVIVAKNRNGQRGECTLIADLSHQKFRSVTFKDPFG